MKNAWGIEVPGRHELFDLSGATSYLRQSLPVYLRAIGAPPGERPALADRIIEIAQGSSGAGLFDERLRSLVQEVMDSEAITKSRNERARVVVDQVRGCLSGPSILDMGAGDGAIGRGIQEATGALVICADLFRAQDFDLNGLPFVLIDEQSGRLSMPDDSFDSVLLASVVHHAEAPQRLLEEAVRLLKPGGSLVMVEAFFDPETGPLAWAHADSDLTRAFMALEENGRIAVTGFMDSVANSGGWSPSIHHMIRCPLNFNSIAGWTRVLTDLQLARIETCSLGVDQPLGAGMFHGLICGWLQ